VIILFLVFTGIAQAKTGNIQGKITTSDGAPIELVNVSLKSTNIGTTTDESGNFELISPKTGKQTLLVSGIGFQSVEQEIEIIENEVGTFDFTLQETAKQLEEFVITAGRQPESLREIPSAVTIVNARQINEQLAINPKPRLTSACNQPPSGT